MKENAILFGKYNNLVGIVTLPKVEPSAIIKRAVIFLNAGILHRVGQNRLYVQIARKLAAKGILCFRFDYSGIGDSATTDTALQHEARIVEETKDAIDYLSTNYNIENFILTGSCSGARDAINMAAEDERVIGVIAINIGLKSSLATYFRSKLFDLHSYKKLISGKVNISHIRNFVFTKLKKNASAKLKSNEIDPLISASNKIYTTEHYCNLIPELNSRQVDILFLCSQWDPSLDAIRQILKKVKKSIGNPKFITSDVITNADHDFNVIVHQNMLTEKINLWIDEHILEKPMNEIKLRKHHPYNNLSFLRNI